MKKISLAFIAAFFAVSIQAQYFHHIYGSTAGQKLSSGVNTNVLGLGHFLAGHGPAGVIASRTDVDGNITGAPYFNSSYALFSPFTGAQLQIEEPQVFEMDNGAGFGLVGKYIDGTTSPSTTGVFYLQLGPAGNVVNVFNYVPNGGSYFVSQVGAVAESVISGGNDIYVTGTVASAAQLHVFAMKLDMSTGGIVWTNIFDMAVPGGTSFARGNDIIESPYAASGTDEVIVVGEVRDGSTANPDGFFMTLDANTGNPIGNEIIFGTAASRDVFNAITVAASSAGGNKGFVISGETDANGDPDFWTVKTDAAGATIWATSNPYGGVAPGIENVSNDIIERLNTTGKYEYYSAGYVYTGMLGAYDMVIVKLDDMGVSSMGFGQFTYGDGKIDYGIAIDQYNGTGADGLSFFGFREGATPPIINGNYDLYLVKAYFNGETPCNQKIIDAPNAGAPKDYTNYSVSTIADFIQDLDLKQRRTRTVDFTICYKKSLADGDNSFVAPEKTGDGIMVSPNPLTSGATVVNVEIESPAAGTVQVAIYDMLGRQYYSNTLAVAKGAGSLPVDISSASLAAGMYNVRVINGTNIKNTLLIVK